MEFDWVLFSIGFFIGGPIGWFGVPWIFRKVRERKERKRWDRFRDRQLPPPER